MKKATGFGGIFFKSEDPKASMTWYKNHLGIEVNNEYGATFRWRTDADPNRRAYTAWSPMEATTNYFNPSEKPFMLNFRVENLEALLAELASNGVLPLGPVEVYSYGKFAHIMDPDGIKIELWEPQDAGYEEILGDQVHQTS